MPNGGTFTVRADNVRVRHEDGFPITGGFVQLSLEDTGVGMSQEVLGRAFEPLFTTKPKGMDTGPGLPQVFAFCERVGGLATIDSAIGAGTAVRLYLPRAAAVAAGAVVKEAPRAAQTKEIQGLRMLLVEDNEEVAAGTEALFTMMGHHFSFQRGYRRERAGREMRVRRGGKAREHRRISRLTWCSRISICPGG